MVLALHLYRRMMRRGRLVALLALASAPGLVAWLAGFDATPEEVAEHYSGVLATVGFAFAIAAVIITTSTLREERDAGTLPYLYMRPIGRLSLAASSLFAGTAAAVTIALGGWVATFLAAVAIDADLGEAAVGAALFVAAAVGYAAVFVPLGYIVPRSLLVGLGYVIVIESILAAAVTGLAQFSVWRIALSIYADLVPVFGGEAANVLGPVTPGAGGGMVKLAGILVAGLAVLTWAFRTRDAL
ncbi:MAG: ABC transporter permease [Acidimicrobiia bacterium]